jgi:hypothetical protein
MPSASLGRKKYLGLTILAVKKMKNIISNRVEYRNPPIDTKNPPSE